MKPAHRTSEIEVSALTGKKPLLTINDIARLTGRSRRTIIRWFENEPGTLLVLDNPERMHQRRYRTLRVPRAILERVIERKRIG